MIRYLIELSILHSLFTLAYWIFLKKERQYGRLRLYLVGSTLLSLLVPLLRLPSFQSLFVTEADPEFTLTLNPVNLITISQTPSDSSNMAVLYWIYGLVAAWLLYRVIIGIVYLVRLYLTSEAFQLNGIPVRKVARLESSFSFFNWIFINKRVETDHEDLLPIILHEHAHVRLGHSYDLLLFQLFRVAFWWLPGAWYAHKEIKKIHEYQADARAIKSYSVDRYSSILISSTLKSSGLSLVSSFHDGLILKRLKAMKQNVTKIKRWKLGVLGILSTLLVLAFACNDELDREIKQMSDQSYQTLEVPDFMQETLAQAQKKYPDQKFVYVEYLVKDGEMSADVKKKLDELPVDLIAAVNVNKEEQVIGILMKEGANLNQASRLTSTESGAPGDEVFTIVEDAPSFSGGMTEFYRYIADNINYPASARHAGIVGKVYVQFVVEKDGSLSDVKTVKGIGGGCDEEAIRVIAGAPAFTPGKQRGKPVRVKMVLPITFSLDGVNSPERVKIATSEPPGGESLEEIVVVGYGQIVNNKFMVSSSYDNGVWTGKIVDQDGKPLPGASIVVAGTTSGTVSDTDGTFRVIADSEKDLVLSYVGYETTRLTNKK